MKANERATLILQERRRVNKILQEERIQEVYNKIPQIKAIDALIKETGFKSLELAANNMDTSLAEEKIKILKSEKDKLLVRNGYKRDYMDLKYHHEACKDTGFIDTKPCSCRLNLIIQDNYEKSGLRAAINRENFSTFDYSLFSKNPYMGTNVSPYDNIVRIVKDIKNYINNFDKQTGNIYIQGEVGRGKTFLINSIAKELLDRNYSVVYMTSTKLFKFLNDYHWAFEDRRENLESQYEMIFDCDLLIIDDLGAETHRSTDQSNLFDVVNERMNKGLPIILSSNLNEDMIEEIYGPRVFSRILGNNSKTYEIFGEDLRLKGTDYDFSWQRSDAGNW